MSHLELFLLLFTDGVMSHLVFPISSGYALTSHLIFSSEFHFLAKFLFWIGAILGTIANYFLGVIFLKSFFSKAKQETFLRTKQYACIQKYQYLIALCAGVPFSGVFISLLCGMFKVRLLTALPIFAISLAVQTYLGY